MLKPFNTNTVPLAQLLANAQDGTLQLPDFQRGWVWSNTHITSLLASISLKYPIGAIMTLRTGNPSVRFRTRPIEGSDVDSQVDPSVLLLDGQQRITSLYFALKSKTPVPTRDNRGKHLLRHYYANIRGCISSTADREEDGIISVPRERVITADFGRKVVMDLRTREGEISNEMFPLDIVLDANATMDWQMEYLGSGNNTGRSRLNKWKLFNEEIVTPFTTYQVPVIELEQSTSKDAVCQVFEKVNTGGVTLTVFELLTATYAAEDFNLRTDWAERKKRFGKYKLLCGDRPTDGIRETDFLQIVTLLSTLERRKEYLEMDHSDDKAPAVSCKRSAMLKLSLSDYKHWSDIVSKALERVVPFLNGEFIFRYRDLPYPTQIIPLAAIFSYLGKLATSQSARSRLRKWFWCGVLGEMYSGLTATTFANDLQDCVTWIEDGDSDDSLTMPRTVREAQFQADRLLTLRTRNSAAYKGLIALQMKRGCRNFRTGEPIDVFQYFDHSVDIIHIFPKRWCARLGYDKGLVGCIVNKTICDRQTARKIRGQVPSRYSRTLETFLNISPADLDAIYRSHDIDPTALRQDDFRAFFNSRFERLIRQIEEATGKAVNRNKNRDDSPFVDADIDPWMVKNSIVTLVKQGESQVVEFKSTARRNLFNNKKDPKIEWMVIKTLCAFLNSSGGTLLIGIDDEGNTIGIERDYDFVHRKNRDGWGLWLNDLASNALGITASTDLFVRYCEIEDRTIARIDVSPSMKPIFARVPKTNKAPHFYVRIGSASKEFQGSEILEYQKKRWRS